MLGSMLKVGRLPIGIDLGSGSVKLAQAKSWSNPSVVASARVPFQSAGIAAMSFEEIRALAREIADAAKHSGFTSNRCVIGLDDRLVRTRSVRQPPMSESEIASAIQIDGRSRLGFNQDEPCELGWLLAGPIRQGDQARDEVILVGCQSKPIESLVMALAEHGVRTNAVEPGFVAAGRLFTRTLRRNTDTDVCSLIVDVGRTITSVIVLRGDNIAFHKSLEIGGANLDEAARLRLGLDPQTITNMRRARLRANGAAPTDPKVERAFFESARSIIADLAHEVTLCLRYMSVTFRAGRPKFIHIIGGDANEPGLREQIFKAIGADAPGAEAPTPDGNCDPAWTVAAGLSIRGAEPQAKKRKWSRAATRPSEPTAEAPPARRAA
ncbi:MAG: pilus assembly protein PilM [Phycisphaeraceae bacterium]|nr:pilus assembly protein PilM [Phycisphaerales bacterium]MCB9843416.1 pilus assembly protein PilM [Phycisphaeraceae bacterium]